MSTSGGSIRQVLRGGGGISFGLGEGNIVSGKEEEWGAEGGGGFTMPPHNEV